MVGEALEPVRDKVVIATKFGFNIARGKAASDAGMNSRPAHIRAVAEASLSGWGPRRSTCSISIASIPMCRSKSRRRGQGADPAEGKVRHFGLSEAGAKTIRRAHAVQPVTALQKRILAVVTRPGGRRIFAVLEEFGIGFVPYSPLGRGFLTGKIDATTEFDQAKCAAVPRSRPEGARANQALVDLLTRAPEKAPPRRRSRWHGSWRRSPGSCRSPAPPSFTDSRRTSPRPISR